MEGNVILKTMLSVH